MAYNADLSLEPKEDNRFGYIVEIDPYDSNAVPKKRTALGRLKHEGTACRITNAGNVAVYSLRRKLVHREHTKFYCVITLITFSSV